MHRFCLFLVLCFADVTIWSEKLISSEPDYVQANAYQNGDAVAQDSSKAFMLFLQCAKRGDPRAEYKVAIAYYIGDGVEKDQVEGLAWMYNAVSSGITRPVCTSMEATLGSEMSLKARERSKELVPAEQGSSNALTQLAEQIRDKALQKTTPQPNGNRPIGFGKYGWHRNIKTALFWVGMPSSKTNPAPRGSSWDTNWFSNFGGYDDPYPQGRSNYTAIGFTPKQNPFYCALPYNDVQSDQTKPEASLIIPWFSDCFDTSGKSVLKGRWVCIHHNGRTCFVQWEDSLPHPSDDWGYVFGKNPPKEGTQGYKVGLFVSPAVRDYLKLEQDALCDWKFIDSGSVPDGPWKFYGDNNTFVLLRRGDNLYERDRNNAGHPSH